MLITQRISRFRHLAKGDAFFFTYHDTLDSLSEVRQRADSHQLERGREIADSFDKAVELAGDSQLVRPHFIALMVDKGLLKDTNKTLDRYLGNKRLGR